ncbi:MAG: NYN domain-containing protein [Actinomycetota bacterium]
MKVNVYIDGLNLYKGALSGRPGLKWLDLLALSRTILNLDLINRIFFFTSPMKRRFSGDLSPERQGTYLRVLRYQGIETISGKTVKYEKWLRHTDCSRKVFVQPPMPKLFGATSFAIHKSWSAAAPDLPKSKVTLFSEKASDVNLASFLLRDSLLGKIERALVVSGDSDLFTPIAISREAGIEVTVAVPNKTQLSSRLKNIATYFNHVSPELLAASQLPKPFETSRGSLIYAPKEWS